MADNSKKEREILLIMRKVLAQVVKDTTPPNRAMRHPLSNSTIEDIRNCLGLISLRERELADLGGAVTEKPYYSDERRDSDVVPISQITRPRDKKGD